MSASKTAKANRWDVPSRSSSGRPWYSSPTARSCAAPCGPVPRRHARVFRPCLGAGLCPADQEAALRFYFFFDVFDFFRGGTLAPFLRASERPMAIACLRLVTFFLDLAPLLSLPLLSLCIAS